MLLLRRHDRRCSAWLWSQTLRTLTVPYLLHEFADLSLVDDPLQVVPASMNVMPSIDACFLNAACATLSQAVPENQQNCLQYVSNIEEAMVKGFPFAVPPEYSGLPQLKARSTPSLILVLPEPSP